MKKRLYVIKAMHYGTKSTVRTNNEESKEFEIREALKQGCVLSPLLFSAVVDEIIKRAKKMMKPQIMGYWK